MRIRLATTAVLLALPLATLASCGNESDSGSSNTSASDSPTAESSPSQSPSSTATPTPSRGKTVHCEYPEDGDAARDVELPPQQAGTGTIEAVIQTNQGDIPIELDGKDAPCTVNSFVSLTQQGFYDDTPCPRIGNMDGFGILQCGDPTGTSAGGPGYSFPDELKGDEAYAAGTLAMANAGPDTNGSQFFLVFKDSQFPPAYTTFGTISEDGLAVLEKIAANGDDASNPAGGGTPNKPVTIEKVTLG